MTTDDKYVLNYIELEINDITSCGKLNETELARINTLREIRDFIIKTKTMKYKDRWFCNVYRNCSKGSACDRAATEGVKQQAEKLGVGLQYADPVDCFVDKKGESQCQEI